ncbi:hypothetical protein PSA01_04580 [Pseudonocardia saturnea]|uniref:Uncharacterized protein n=1 Tax=Pseudonocardia saturnea TaxID=33909 RepID=A0ABQ0RRX1_9PSEU|nr:hypothetical protein Pdca_34440 [Pseudonocardia autotrophica]GEC23429.1 hypothetical protein PSA01_04580 [Pseudonocardia saturnea]
MHRTHGLAPFARGRAAHPGSHCSHEVAPSVLEPAAHTTSHRSQGHAAAPALSDDRARLLVRRDTTSGIGRHAGIAPFTMPASRHSHGLTPFARDPIPCEPDDPVRTVTGPV